MPLRSQSNNDKNKLNTSINTTTEISTNNGTDTLTINKDGNNLTIDNIFKVVDKVLGTKANGQQRAPYDVVQDCVPSLKDGSKKKKKKKHKKKNYSFLQDIEGKKKKHKKKKHKKCKKFSKILGF